MRRLLPILLLCLLVMPVAAQSSNPVTNDEDSDYEPAPQWATEDTFALIAVPRANVRTAPNIITGRVSTIAKIGERYQILERRESEADGEWLLIAIDGDTGWIFADLVLIANPDGIIEGDDNDLNLARTNQLADYIAATVGVRGALRVRSAPSLDAPIITVVPFGERAYPIGRNSLNSWILIDYGGTLGWVSVFGVVPPPQINLFGLPVVR